MSVGELVYSPAQAKHTSHFKTNYRANTAVSPSHPGVLHDPLILADFRTSSQLLGSCVQSKKRNKNWVACGGPIDT